MSNLILPICNVCGGSMRFVRRDELWKCSYCPNELSKDEGLKLMPKPAQTAPEPQESTIMQVFNAVTRPTASAATSTTPANHYDLRSEK